MSTDTISLIQAVIHDQLRSFRTADLGLVTQVYSHEASADKNNYECDVRLRDSGLEITEANAERIGVSIGAGIGGLPGIEKNYDAYLKGGPRKISPFFVPANIINMISGNLSIMYGLKGPNIAMVTACTTGTHNIGKRTYSAG